MTNTTTPSREVLGRASQHFNRDDKLTWDAALDLAEVELAREAQQQAEAERDGQEKSDSLGDLWSCSACGASKYGSTYALCGDCLAGNYILDAESRLADMINGHARRDLLLAYRQRKAGTTRT
jgi:hypothetical protein